jgi:glycosyltransferase involved in cell wall biosynthesis
MRILLILPVNIFPGKTGDSIHIYNLCKAWAAKGHFVHVVTLRSEQQEEAFEQKDGFKVSRLPFTISPISQLSIDSLKSIIKLPLILTAALLFSLGLMITQDFDLIFVRYRPLFSIISLVAGKLARKPIITKFAGTAVYTYLKLPFEKYFFKLLIACSSFLIADNSYMAKVFEKEIPKNKLQNIPPPVSLDSFQSHLPKNQKPPGRKFVVLYVSSFRKDEDVEKFVLASGIVSKKIPSMSFVMVGDGVTKSAAVKLSERLGVTSNLSFIDSIPHKEIPDLLANSDLLVAFYVPKYMAIPIKILEYGFAGKPILTTKNVAEIFENEIDTFKAKDNFYVVDSNVNSIVDALVELYENAELRNRIAKNMHDMVVENFSLDIVSNRYLDLFKEATKRPR